MILRRDATCLRDERWRRGMKPDSYGLRGLRAMARRAASRQRGPGHPMLRCTVMLHGSDALGLLKAKRYHS